MHTNRLSNYLAFQQSAFLCAAARVVMAGVLRERHTLDSHAFPSPLVFSPSSTVAPIIALSQTTVPLIPTMAGPPGHDYLLNPLLGDDGLEGHESERKTTIASATSVTKDGSDYTMSNAFNRTPTMANVNAPTNAGVVNNNGKDETLRPTSSGFATVTRITTEIASTASSSLTRMPSPNSATSSNSSSTLNSWKIIGIGILAFAAVVALILGFAFHDALLRPVKNCLDRKRRARETLMPDWNRRSWRFGVDHFDDSGKDVDDMGPRVLEGEKGSLQYPLPPVSPFPLRRKPSNITVTNGMSVLDVPYERSRRHSIKLSPPSATPKITITAASREQTLQVDRANASSSSRSSSDSDAYGGIMESGFHATLS